MDGVGRWWWETGIGGGVCGRLRHVEVARGGVQWGENMGLASETQCIQGRW